MYKFDYESGEELGKINFIFFVIFGMVFFDKSQCIDFDVLNEKKTFM